MPYDLRPEVEAVRALALFGQPFIAIAKARDCSERRVKHLLTYYGDARTGLPTRALTWGLCRDVRESWSLGRYRDSEQLAADMGLTVPQVAAIRAGADGTHVEGPYQDAPRRRKARRGSPE